MVDERHPGSLGLASGTVRVVPYDPAWAQLYAHEQARLTVILSEHGLALRLEHTGSTSVPGLAAKPILDILAGHSPDTSRQAMIDALVDAGYTYRGEQGIVGRPLAARFPFDRESYITGKTSLRRRHPARDLWMNVVT